LVLVFWVLVWVHAFNSLQWFTHTRALLSSEASCVPKNWKACCARSWSTWSLGQVSRNGSVGRPLRNSCDSTQDPGALPL
jgi:hypothetical protein